MEENKKTITHVFCFRQKYMYVKIVIFQELRLSDLHEKALTTCMSSLNNPGNAIIIMEYRTTQNRARRDIPMRHEARHDIVTRDLVCRSITYHEISEMNKCLLLSIEQV
jgi:hypothetical protein